MPSGTSGSPFRVPAFRGHPLNHAPVLAELTVVSRKPMFHGTTVMSHVLLYLVPQLPSTQMNEDSSSMVWQPTDNGS